MSGDLTRSIPVMMPRLPDIDSLSQYLRRIDEARIYSNFGPMYSAFSERLALYFGVQTDQIAVLANGTQALQAAVETIGDSGDVWVVPSWTFVATGQAVMSARRRIHFSDVSRRTWALEPQSRPFARGQVVVAPFGSRPDLEGWRDIAGFKIHDAASCFDACRGIGSALDDRTMIMVSLHATKPLAAGEGAVLVGPSDWIRKCAVWGNFGFDGSRVASGPGMNAKISEYHCAVGQAALDEWERRRACLNDALISAKEISRDLGLRIQPAFEDNWVTTTWNVELPEGRLSAAESFLHAAGVSTRRWWPIGVHMMAPFSEQTRDGMEVTEQLQETTLGLPFGEHMDDDHFEYVADCLRRVL